MAECDMYEVEVALGIGVEIQSTILHLPVKLRGNKTEPRH